MMILLIAVLVLVVGAVVAVVVGRVGVDTMSPPTETSPFAMPSGRLGSAGVDAVRLDQSLRGYNMAQVDAVLDRLFDEIHDLEAQLERRGGVDAREDGGRVPVFPSAAGEEPEQPAGDVVQFRRRTDDE